MTYVLLPAFVLGLAAGLRALGAPAILLLMRRGGAVAIVVGVLALGEYMGDMLPNVFPARTSPPLLIGRIVSGGFVGWSVAVLGGGSAPAGAIVGIAGALVGAYGGLALRRKFIAAIGAVPAALLEDAVSIVLGVAAVAST